MRENNIRNKLILHMIGADPGTEQGLRTRLKAGALIARRLQKLLATKSYIYGNRRNCEIIAQSRRAAGTKYINRLAYLF